MKIENFEIWIWNLKLNLKFEIEKFELNFQFNRKKLNEV